MSKPLKNQVYEESRIENGNDKSCFGDKGTIKFKSINQFVNAMKQKVSLFPSHERRGKKPRGCELFHASTVIHHGSQTLALISTEYIKPLNVKRYSYYFQAKTCIFYSSLK